MPSWTNWCARQINFKLLRCINYSRKIEIVQPTEILNVSKAVSAKQCMNKDSSKGALHMSSGYCTTGNFQGRKLMDQKICRENFHGILNWLHKGVACLKFRGENLLVDVTIICEGFLPQKFPGSHSPSAVRDWIWCILYTKHFPGSDIVVVWTSRWFIVIINQDIAMMCCCILTPISFSYRRWGQRMSARLQLIWQSKHK